MASPMPMAKRDVELLCADPSTYQVELEGGREEHYPGSPAWLIGKKTLWSLCPVEGPGLHLKPAGYLLFLTAIFWGFQT